MAKPHMNRINYKRIYQALHQLKQAPSPVTIRRAVRIAFEMSWGVRGKALKALVK